MKDLRCLAAKRSKVEEGMTGFEVDEEIHVAFGFRLTASKRSEGPQMADAVSAGGFEQSAALTTELVCLRPELASDRGGGSRGFSGGRLDLQAPAARGKKSLQGRQGRKRRTRLVAGQG